jgi:HPt (histidine-containing phosphotransfer) domain-containing protein
MAQFGTEANSHVRTGHFARLDEKALAALRSLGADAFEQIVAVFRVSAANLVARAEAATASGDAQALRDATHALKSSSAQLGALRLSEIARELENLGRVGRIGPEAAPLAAEARRELTATLDALASRAVSR